MCGILLCAGAANAVPQETAVIVLIVESPSGKTVKVEVSANVIGMVSISESYKVCVLCSVRA